VVIGISYSMFEILYNPWKCSLSKPGTSLAKGDNFGAIEGYKMAADLISPVSGTVVQINPLVVGIVDTADGALIALADPYNQGWMMVIQLSKPAELNSLLTPQKYASFVHG
jgi:glycine cleavage system H protein